jgi:H+/Cl- antiporter ClcA
MTEKVKNKVFLGFLSGALVILFISLFYYVLYSPQLMLSPSEDGNDEAIQSYFEYSNRVYILLVLSVLLVVIFLFIFLRRVRQKKKEIIGNKSKESL